jgi:enoyl-CoA hydratase/carnithine racemase
VPLVAIQSQGPVTLIRLSRPDKRNAMTPVMLDELWGALTHPPASSRALLLHGEGPAFCAGFDLAICKADTSGKTMAALLTGLSACICAMRESDLPIIVAAHGSAIAGGCALLAGADLVVADRACTLGYPVTRIGVSPAVNAPFVNAALGQGPARQRLLDTALITADRAPGLVHELVDSPSDVLPRALALAHDLAAKGPAAIAATKLLLQQLDNLAAPGGAQRGLAASLALVGGAEEQRLLSRLTL